MGQKLGLNKLSLEFIVHLLAWIISVLRNSLSSFALLSFLRGGVAIWSPIYTYFNA